MVRMLATVRVSKRPFFALHISWQIAKQTHYL